VIDADLAPRKAFVDSTVLIKALWEESASAKEALNGALQGRYGQLFSSLLVIDDVVKHGIRTEKPDVQQVKSAIQYVYNFVHIPPTMEDISFAKSCADKYSAMKLSITDWITVRRLKEDKMQVLLSCNTNFDKIQTVGDLKQFASFVRIPVG